MAEVVCAFVMGGVRIESAHFILEASYSGIWQTNGFFLSVLSIGLFPWSLSLVSFLGLFSLAVDIWPFTFVAHTEQWRESKRLFLCNILQRWNGFVFLVCFQGLFSFTIYIWQFTYVQHTGQWREWAWQIVDWCERDWMGLFSSSVLQVSFLGLFLFSVYVWPFTYVAHTHGSAGNERDRRYDRDRIGLFSGSVF